MSLKITDYRPRFLLEKDYNHPDGEVRKFGIFAAELSRDKAELIAIEPDEVAAIKWFTIKELTEKMASAVSELVPSANSVWPDTFQAIWPETYKSLKVETSYNVSP